MHKTCAICYKIEVMGHLQSLQTTLSTGLSTLLWITDHYIGKRDFFGRCGYDSNHVYNVMNIKSKRY